MLVTRILIDNQRAVGVEALDARAPTGRTQPTDPTVAANKVTITATREVILCGGAINSPQLLMLSGIGPGTSGGTRHRGRQGPSRRRAAPAGSRRGRAHLSDEEPARQGVAMAIHRAGRGGSPIRSHCGSVVVHGNLRSSRHRLVQRVRGSEPHASRFAHSRLHVFFRDFNLNPQRWVDPDPLKSFVLRSIPFPSRRHGAEGVQHVPDRMRQASAHARTDCPLERGSDRAAGRGSRPARGRGRPDPAGDGHPPRAQRDGASDPAPVRRRGGPSRPVV